MAYTTLRLKKTRKTGDPLRTWLAIMLMVGAVIAAFLIFTRDMDWETRSREARRLGLIAEHNGNYDDARAHFETALTNHPYDWETHLSLANLLNNYLNDQDDSLRHYLYALAYSPESSIVRPTEEKIRILRYMRTGEMEDPRNALEDMFIAMEMDAKQLFSRRLSPMLREDVDAYWAAWKRRGRGKVVYCSIESQRDGFFDAMMTLEYPDSTVMSMHLECALRDLWYLELSFP